MIETVIKTINVDSNAYGLELELRNEVLRKPIGLDLRLEDLSNEVNDFHIGAFKDTELVGCLILTPINEQEIKMRQVAVKDNLQGLGIGRKLVEHSERVAKENHYNKVILNARKTATEFYKRLGYNVVGGEFTEVGIPHFKMHKDL